MLSLNLSLLTFPVAVRNSVTKTTSPEPPFYTFHQNSRIDLRRSSWGASATTNSGRSSLWVVHTNPHTIYFGVRHGGILQVYRIIHSPQTYNPWFYPLFLHNHLNCGCHVSRIEPSFISMGGRLIRLTTTTNPRPLPCNAPKAVPSQGNTLPSFRLSSLPLLVWSTLLDQLISQSLSL